MAQIYVQIPAYRDRELARTLVSLYRRAAAPEQLRVRVAWQFGPGEALPKALGSLPNLEIEAIPARLSQGCNWARQRLQSAWKGEPYTLLLDSHHRFVTGWDRLALDMFAAATLAGAERPILTAYLPNYDPEAPQHRRRRPYKIYPYAREAGVLTRLTSYPIAGWSGLAAPIKADFVSLHFLLAEGRFNADVPMDPSIYFFGDEVHTSVRAFAAGYRFFHPHRVLGWHAYHRASRTPHWEDHADWADRNQRAMARLKAQYHPGNRIGRSSVTIAEFERYSGVELQAR